MTIPAAEAAVAVSEGHIGVIGTTRTIASGTFAMEVAKLGPHRVTALAAPLLAPIVEEAWHDTEIARLAVARYVAGFDDIDTLVLSCTHYPLLMPAFRAAVRPGVRVLDPESRRSRAAGVVAAASSWLHAGRLGNDPDVVHW